MRNLLIKKYFSSVVAALGLIVLSFFFYLVYLAPMQASALTVQTHTEAKKEPVKEEKKEPEPVQQQQQKEVEQVQQPVVTNTMTVVVTAYDLSVDSCGKYPSHPAYGITASGYNLKGHTLESARAIAVDPNVIPLGSKIRLTFPPGMERYNGVYTAVDTGGGIVGNHIDLFMGDFQSQHASQAAINFGRQTATAELL